MAIHSNIINNSSAQFKKMLRLLPDYNRTKGYGPGKAERKGVHVVRRNRKLAQERRTEQIGPFMDGR